MINVEITTRTRRAARLDQSACADALQFVYTMEEGRGQFTAMHTRGDSRSSRAAGTNVRGFKDGG
jgi:hypothetical protein